MSDSKVEEFRATLREKLWGIKPADKIRAEREAAEKIEKARVAKKRQDEKDATDILATYERARIKGIMSLPGDHAKLEWLAYSTNVTVADAENILAKEATTEAETKSKTDPVELAKRWIDDAHARAKGRG